MNNTPNRKSVLQNDFSRRQFLNRFGMGFGGIALTHLMSQSRVHSSPGHLPSTHTPPKAKRVIYLFQSGAPSQLDLFDYKPLLQKEHGSDLPDSIRKGQRLTAMTGSQSRLPLAGIRRVVRP